MSRRRTAYDEMKQPNDEAKKAMADLSDRYKRRLRTIRFQTALWKSDLSVALSNEWTVPDAVDNSACYVVGHSNPVRLWSQMEIRSNAAKVNAVYEAKLQKILDLLLATGAAKFLNEVGSDGNRPVDVAGHDQRRILFTNAAMYGVNLRPTTTQSPLYRCGTGAGYSMSSVRPVVEAVDPALYDWIHPKNGDTALHAFCRFAANDMNPDVLESIEYLLSLIGFVNPLHSCFDVAPITDPLLLPRLSVARELTAEYRSVHLPKQIRRGIGSLSSAWTDLVPLIVLYVF